MSDPQSSQYTRVLSFHFSGNALEFFKIWIVNLALTIVTLGIYSAWAKVRRIRYFYGNTHVNDNVFNYIADSVRILIGRIIAVSALVIYSLTWDFYPNHGMILLSIGLLLLPFLLVTATSFQMRNSTYCHIQFYFGRNYIQAYRMVVIPIGIVLLLTWAGYSFFDIGNWLETLETEDSVKISKNDFLPSIFLLALIPIFPYLDYLCAKFVVNNTQYGQLKAEFGAKGSDFYKIYLIVLVLTTVVLGTITLAIVGVSFMYLQGREGVEDLAVKDMMTFIIISIFQFYTIFFFISGYLRAARTNLIYGKTTFGEIQVNSRLKAMRVGWIYLSNVAVIICSFTLLIPWAKVRMAKYVASCMELETKNIAGIEAQIQKEYTALGEEFVGVFGIDIGL